MSYELKFDGNVGIVSIYDNNNSNAFTNPIQNLDDVKFHNYFKYMSILRNVTKTIVLPALTNTGTYARSIVLEHLPSVPFLYIIGSINGKVLNNNSVTLVSNTSSMRLFNLEWDNNQLYLVENGDTGSEFSTVPALTITIDISYITYPSLTVSSSQICVLTPTTISIGNHRLNDSTTYLKQTTALANHYLTAKETIGLYLSGFAAVNSNNVVTTHNSYSSTFIAPTRYGINTQ